MNDAPTRIRVNTETAGYWRVTLDHPPINTVDDRMYDEIYDLVERIEAEMSLKVVTFESANPDFLALSTAKGFSITLDCPTKGSFGRRNRSSARP